MARPFSFEIHPIFVPNFHEKVSFFARDFGQESLFFRVNFFNCYSRNRRRHRFGGGYHWPSRKKKNTFIHFVANNSTTKTNPFFLFSFMMAQKTHFTFRLSVGFFAVFVIELVTMFRSQFISSFVVESTVVKFPVTFTTVVVVPYFTRKISNWLFIPWFMVQYTIYIAGIKKPMKTLCISLFKNVIEKRFRDLLIEIPPVSNNFFRSPK